MRLYYYRCRKCGREVYVSKRIHHLIKEHGFKAEDFPYTQIKAAVLPYVKNWFELWKAENRLLGEWFLPSRVEHDFKEAIEEVTG